MTVQHEAVRHLTTKIGKKAGAGDTGDEFHGLTEERAKNKQIASLKNERAIFVASQAPIAVVDNTEQAMHVVLSLRAQRRRRSDGCDGSLAINVALLLLLHGEGEKIACTTISWSVTA